MSPAPGGFNYYYYYYYLLCQILLCLLLGTQGTRIGQKQTFNSHCRCVAWYWSPRVTELPRDSKDAEFPEQSSGGLRLEKIRALFEIIVIFDFMLWQK